MKKIFPIVWASTLFLILTGSCSKDQSKLYLVDQSLSSTEFNALLEQSFTIHQLMEFTNVDNNPCRSKVAHDGETVMVHAFLYPMNYFPEENRLVIEGEDSTGFYAINLSVVENQDNIFKMLREKVDPESIERVPILVKGTINSLQQDTWCYTAIEIRCFDMYIP